MKRLRNALVATAIALGLVMVTPTPSPVMAADPVPESVSGCKGFKTTNPSGGYAYCTSADYNDRYRVDQGCVQTSWPWLTTTRYGAAQRPTNASIAQCPSGYQRLVTLTLQWCDLWGYNGLKWVCYTGWAYRQAWELY